MADLTMFVVLFAVPIGLGLVALLGGPPPFARCGECVAGDPTLSKYSDTLPHAPKSPTLQSRPHSKFTDTYPTQLPNRAMFSFPII
jgi:hypothetical protein